jgi:hypothetical protein
MSKIYTDYMAWYAAHRVYVATNADKTAVAATNFVNRLSKWKEVI